MTLLTNRIHINHSEHTNNPKRNHQDTTNVYYDRDGTKNKKYRHSRTDV